MARRQRVMIATTIDPKIKTMLERMSTDDLRTLRGQLEWLILREHARRQQANTLADRGREYVTATEEVT